MPDETRYDNKGIESALRKSAVVIIGLSPPYLKSERCAIVGVNMHTVLPVLSVLVML